MNVKGEIKGDLLFLTVDCSDKAKALAKPSASGKTRTLASTMGFTSFGHGVKISLNASIPNED